MIPWFLCLLPALAAEPDPVFDGIVAEVERAKTLQLPGQGPPHHILVRAQDGWELRSRARMGQLDWSRVRPNDALKIQVRAGTPAFDSSGLDTGWMGTGIDTSGLPDAPSVRAVRERLWWDLDVAYKDAVETLGRKLGAKDVLRTEEVADRDWQTVDDPVVEVQRSPVEKPDLEVPESMVTRLSGRLRDRGFEEVEVEFSERVGHRIIVGSDGTRVVSPYRWVWLGMKVEVRDANHESRTFRDFVTVRTRDELPAVEALAARLDVLADRADAWAAAPRLEAPWYGPTLVEDRAAAGLFSGQVVFATRGTPTSADWQSWDQTVRPRSSWFERPGTRLLPPGWTVVDDPTREEGRCCYAIDWEGTRARPVTLVEDGVVVGHMMSRTPNKYFSESTGHARPGDDTERANAKPSWTTVTPPRTISRAKLRKLALKEARRQGLDRVFLLRHPGSGVGEWLFADGHTELVRGATTNELDARSLRTMTVAGPVHTFDLNGGRARMSAPDVFFRSLAVEPVPASPEPPRRRTSPLVQADR